MSKVIYVNRSSSSSSGDCDCQPSWCPSQSNQQERQFASLVAFASRDPFPGLEIQPQTQTNLGTQPLLQLNVVQGNWQAGQGSVRVPSTGVYQVTIDTSFQQRYATGQAPGYSAFSIFATKNGTSLQNLIVPSLISGDIPVPPEGFDFIKQLSSTFLVNANQGDQLIFYASRLEGQGSIPVYASSESVLHQQNSIIIVQQPWYKVTIVKL